MSKNFDELLPKNREFDIRGQKFHYLDLSPEDVFAEVEEPKNGDGVWELSDRQILRFLPESEHEAWRALRADKESPITIKQLNQLLRGTPTPQPLRADPSQHRRLGDVDASK
jgi:hypothetical protein